MFDHRVLVTKPQLGNVNVNNLAHAVTRNQATSKTDSSQSITHEITVSCYRLFSANNFTFRDVSFNLHPLGIAAPDEKRRRI
jgi:hypothetical protein